MPPETKPTPPPHLVVPPEPNEEAIEALLAQFVARQNERLNAGRARRGMSSVATKSRGKGAGKKT